MAFLGNQPAAQFTTIPTVQRFNGTGSATEFTLDRTVASVQSIMVSVDGVIQDTSSYTIPDGVTLTFSSAPSSGTGNIFINYLGLVLGTVTHPSTSSLSATSGTFSNNVTVEQQIAAKAPAFRVYMSGSQTFSNTTATVCAFNTEVFDTTGAYNTGDYKFTPLIAGYYFFKTQIFWSSSARCMVGFYKNGSSDTETFAIPGTADGGANNQSHAIIYLDTDDYVQAIAYQASGGNLTNNANIALSNFSGHLLMAT